MPPNLQQGVFGPPGFHHQQQLHQLPHQSLSQLAQVLSQQTQALQLSPWSVYIPQGQTVPNSLSTAAVVPGSARTDATTPALAPIGGQVALPPCYWTEHTSPKGDKYYYNSVTNASKL
ncbi:hypothetical protein MKX03_032660 [Papaver bracteatum]|nr:hypothetical protein MKX03_032660 [Papaver bracteatum]